MKILKSKSFVAVMTMALIIGMGSITPIRAASVAPGGSFSASFSCGVYEGSVKVSGSNATVTSAGNWCDRGGSVTASAKAGSSGTASITFTAGDMTNTSSMTEVAAGTYLGGNSVSVVATSGGGSSNGGGGSSNTNVPEKDDRSSNANLASLSVSEGKLSPSFSADVTEYTVNLGATVTKIKVDASVADSKSSVSGTGENTLKAGDNKITITVTAENGSTKAYVINAKVDEKPLINMTYNNLKLGVVRNVDDISAPASFEKGTIKIDGKEVTSWTSKILKLTLVYLVDETGNKDFYIYDTATKKVDSIFKPTTILGHNVFIVDIKESQQNMNGFKYKKVKIDTTEMMGWEYKDSSMKNYSLIKVMDENGKMQFYQYEKTQNTLQLYSGAAPVSSDAYDKLTDSLDSAELMRNIFIGTTALLLCTTIVGMVLFLNARKKKE